LLALLEQFLMQQQLPAQCASASAAAAHLLFDQFTVHSAAIASACNCWYDAAAAAAGPAAYLLIAMFPLAALLHVSV
jgi:hypothetical protein